jgi:hypothetical protein
MQSNLCITFCRTAAWQSEFDELSCSSQIHARLRTLPEQ